MTTKTYIDPSLTKDLQLPDADIDQAINESISYAYEIYKKQLEVTDMKVSLWFYNFRHVS